MKLYQTYHSEDMAISDVWLPSLAKAIAHVRRAYDIKGAIKLAEDGEWHGTAEDGFEVYIVRHNITPNGEGICSALTHLPNR